jgi:hypothetical protein
MLLCCTPAQVKTARYNLCHLPVRMKHNTLKQRVCIDNIDNTPYGSGSKVWHIMQYEVSSPEKSYYVSLHNLLNLSLIKKQFFQL